MLVVRKMVRPASGLLVAPIVTGAVLAVPLAADAAPLPSECAQAAGTVSCTYTQVGRYSTFVTPAGVSAVQVVVSGASGGDGIAFTDNGVTGLAGQASPGQRVVGTLPVDPGEVLDVAASDVGQDGHLGTAGGTYFRGGGGGQGDGSGGPGSYYNDGAGASGGGGGASSISGPSGQLIVAGGGAGGGGAGTAGRPGGNGQGLGPRVSGPGGGAGGYRDGTEGGGGGGGGGFAGGAGGAAGAGPGEPGEGGYSGRNLVPAGLVVGVAAPHSAGIVQISYRLPSGTPPGGSTPSPSRTVDLSDDLTGPLSLRVGQSGTLVLTVTNNGGVAATSVRSTIVLPPGLVTAQGARQGAIHFDLATLAPGQTRSQPFAVTATRAKPRVHVTATTKSGTSDANTRDNRSEIFVEIR